MHMHERNGLIPIPVPIPIPTGKSHTENAPSGPIMIAEHGQLKPKKKGMPPQNDRKEKQIKTKDRYTN